MIMYSKVIEGWIAYYKNSDGTSLYFCELVTDCEYDTDLRRASIYDSRDEAINAVKRSSEVVSENWQYEFIRLSVNTIPDDI